MNPGDFLPSEIRPAQRTGTAWLYFCEDSETVALTTQGSGLVAGSQDRPWGDRRWSKAQNIGYAGRVWSCRTQVHSQQHHTCTCTLTDLMGNVLTQLTNRLMDVLQGRRAVRHTQPSLPTLASFSVRYVRRYGHS